MLITSIFVNIGTIFMMTILMSLSGNSYHLSFLGLFLLIDFSSFGLYLPNYLLAG